MIANRSMTETAFEGAARTLAMEIRRRMMVKYTLSIDDVFEDPGMGGFLTRSVGDVDAAIDALWWAPEPERGIPIDMPDSSGVASFLRALGRGALADAAFHVEKDGRLPLQRRPSHITHAEYRQAVAQAAVYAARRKPALRPYYIASLMERHPLVVPEPYYRCLDVLRHTDNLEAAARPPTGIKQEAVVEIEEGEDVGYPAEAWERALMVVDYAGGDYERMGAAELCALAGAAFAADVWEDLHRGTTYRPNPHRGSDEWIAGSFGERDTLVPNGDEDMEILQGAARAFWAMAWADDAEERGESLSQQNIYDAAPPTPERAEQVASEFLVEVERLNGRSLTELYEEAVRAPGKHLREPTPEDFGVSLALMSAGTGSSWFDDHPDFPLRVPATDYEMKLAILEGTNGASEGPSWGE